EVIGDAALIADPEDVPDLTRKLRAIATDPDLRDRLRQRGLRQARRFDWRETAAATLNLYERTAAIHSGWEPATFRPLTTTPRTNSRNSPVSKCPR
ncbi:MAG TPA: hypothetical protein VK615_11155, partial [Candidatus Binatia bacterium]|nr:hypothetical protein [Candidatus Binatia bacterium]